MPMHPLIGHTTERQRIAHAINRGSLPQLLLLTGTAGIGKQRLGLWIAQRLFCETPGETEPCGRCRSCRQVLGLTHPDLHWVVPVLRPKGGDADRQVDELADALGEAMEARRKQPLYGPPEGMAGHFVATSRLVARRASMRPVQERGKVFLIGYAERLVPQESSPEAANALLKLFEEPPQDTWFILTAADAEDILPTIRSRAVRLGLGRLDDATVLEFLGAQAGMSRGRDLDARVARAEGAIGAAVAEDEDAGKARATAAALLGALRQGGPAAWEVALKQPPFSARGDFTALLDALARQLGTELRQGLEQPGAGATPDDLLAALEQIAEAREAAQQNVNPQLLLAVLGRNLAGAS